MVVYLMPQVASLEELDSVSEKIVYRMFLGFFKHCLIVFNSTLNPEL